MHDDPDALARGADEMSQMFAQYAKVLRGEHEDFTGRGCWQILCDQLERSMGVKVITVQQWEYFLDLEKERPS